MANNETENTPLSNLRDWLLPLLMNGQVKIENVAKESVKYKVNDEELNIVAES